MIIYYLTYYIPYNIYNLNKNKILKRKLLRTFSNIKVKFFEHKIEIFSVDMKKNNEYNLSIL